jgi:exonuclease III
MRGVDTWRFLHGNKRGYTYHGEPASEWGQSCDRVDLGVVSGIHVQAAEDEKGVLIGAQIFESVEEREGSDHVPISVILDLTKLKGRIRKLRGA